MKLTEIDRQVIQFVEHNADASVKLIAKSLKIRLHKARRIMERLISEGVLNRQYLFNLYPLGLREYALYCSFSETSKAAVARFLSYCQKQERVNYLLELGGDFQLQIAFFAVDGEDAEEFLQSVNEAFPRFLSTQLVVQALRLYEFGARKLHLKPTSQRLLNFGCTGEHHTIDKLDHEILKSLSSNPSHSTAEMARAIGTPGNTVVYRIKRLRDIGVISGVRFIVDSSGEFLDSFRVTVSTRGVTRKLEESILSYCDRAPQVTYLVRSLGSWEFDLGVRAASIGEVRDLIEEMRDHFGQDLLEIRIFPVFRVSKLTKYPFIRFPKLLERN